MKIAYITDQKLPRKATDTEQFVSMCSAFGSVGVDLTLVSVRPAFSKTTSSKEITNYFNVSDTIKSKELVSLPFRIRAIEKLWQGIRVCFSKELKQADIVYSRNLNIIIPVLLFTSKKVVFETYRPLPNQSIWLKPWLNVLKSAKNLQRIILHSEFAKKSFVQYGFDLSKLNVVHNGFDPDKIKPVLSKEEARLSLGINQNDFIITYSGTVNLNKGLDLVLDIVDEFKGIQFYFIGSSGENEFEKLARNHSNVTVIGWMEQKSLIPYLYASDVLLIPPSDKPLKQIGNTVLPIKTFIYMAVGKPIIAPNSEDLSELLVDKVNAYLVNVNSKSDFIETIKTIYSNREEANLIGENAQKQTEHLTWKNRASQIVHLLAE